MAQAMEAEVAQALLPALSLEGLAYVPNFDFRVSSFDFPVSVAQALLPVRCSN